MANGKMKAAVLHAFKTPLSVEEIDIPTPGSGEVLVKVMASGLCLSDVHIQDGVLKTVKPPYIPGHEMAGIVWELGEGVKDRGLKVGQHVLCGIDIVCGKCALCRMGRENLCVNRVRVGFERDGSHAEYAVVPYENLHVVPDSLPFEQAAIIPDAVACMYHAVKDIGQAQPGDRALIYGVGALGLQGVQIAKHFGCEVYACARTPEKLEMARKFGADAVINSRTQSLAAEIGRLTGGEMCDVIYDLVGNAGTIDELLPLIRPGGKIVALSYAADAFSINCQELVIKEKEVLGIRGSTSQNLKEALELVVEGKITPYVSARYRLDQINDALQALRESRSLGRSVIVFDS